MIAATAERMVGEPIEQAPAAPSADRERLNGDEYDLNGSADDSCKNPNV